MPYYYGYGYGYGYHGYGDFLANNIYVLLLIPVLALSLWAQFQVSSSFRRYSAVNNRRHLTGARASRPTRQATLCSTLWATAPCACGRPSSL